MILPLVALTMGFRHEEAIYRIGLAYVSALESAGSLVMCLPHTEMAKAHTGRILDIAQGLVLAGGTDIDPIHYDEEPRIPHKEIDPMRDEFELALCREAMSRDLPILAICRGIQVLNVAAGGTLYQDVSHQTSDALLHEQSAPRWHPTHNITLSPGSMMARILDCEECRVNSFHHQTIREIAPGFLESARASDGTIEAIENPNAQFMIGVQWHPETLTQRSLFWLRLFERFVAACLQESTSQ